MRTILYNKKLWQPVDGAVTTYEPLNVDAEIEELKKTLEEWRSDAFAYRDELGSVKDIAGKLQKENARLREALNKLCSVVATVNYGKHHEIMVPDDDQPVLPQRKEWVEYLLEENNKAQEALKEGEE